MLANDWAQLFTWWCDQDSAYQDSQVFLYERYKSACSSHSLQIFLNPKLMAKQKPQSLLWAWCRNDCFCKLCLHKPTGICMEVHPLRLNLIWLPIANDLNVGNQWANLGTATVGDGDKSPAYWWQSDGELRKGTQKYTIMIKEFAIFWLKRKSKNKREEVWQTRKALAVEAY